VGQRPEGAEEGLDHLLAAVLDGPLKRTSEAVRIADSDGEEE
jgi:hypothetical protein